jgi:hypothetical protein
MRKASNELLSKESTERFHETQVAEAVVLVSDSLAEPAQLEQNFRRSSTSMALSVIYGHPRITSEENHIADLINDFIHRIACAGCPGAHLVEIFPWMRYIPSR